MFSIHEIQQHMFSFTASIKALPTWP